MTGMTTERVGENPMVLTAEERQSILNLCGFAGNPEPGILFLQMNRECSRDDAQTAVAEVQREAEIGAHIGRIAGVLPLVDGRRLDGEWAYLVATLRGKDAALRSESDARRAAEERATRAENVVAKLPKCWRLNEAGGLVQDAPVIPGMTVWCLGGRRGQRYTSDILVDDILLDGKHWLVNGLADGELFATETAAKVAMMRRDTPTPNATEAT